MRAQGPGGQSQQPEISRERARAVRRVAAAAAAAAIALTGVAATAVAATAQRHGFLVNAVQPDAIRLAPPLILSAEQADSFTAELPSILSSASVLTGAGPGS